MTLSEWNSSRVKNTLKSMEMKTNAKVSFARTLLVPWIKSLSSTAQDDEHGKGSKIQNNGKCFQGKISQQVTKYGYLFQAKFIWYSLSALCEECHCFWLTHLPSLSFVFQPSRQFPLNYLTIELTSQVYSKWAVCVFVLGFIFDGVGDYKGSWYLEQIPVWSRGLNVRWHSWVIRTI